MKATNQLFSVWETQSLIEENRVLILAGKESLLNQLPTGSWIGGTIPYFMSENGGCFSDDQIFVTDLTPFVEDIQIRSYAEDELNGLIRDRYDTGFTYVLIPGMSSIHSKYALEAENLKGIFEIPILGWICGIDINELGKRSPKTINGTTNEVHPNKMVALHAKGKESWVSYLTDWKLSIYLNRETVAL